MTVAREGERVTPAEYLARERQAQARSEYLGGFVVAMTGASRRHNHISLNIAVALDRQLGDGPCEPYINDMRVKVGETGDYTYPNVVIACGDVQFEDGELDTLLTPTVIIEVLSPTTERYDRGAKFESYRELPTLREYVLVAQDHPSVEHYARRGAQWILTVITDLGATVQLPAIGCELSMREIYRRVQFGQQPDTKSNGAEPSVT